ncbi:MAG: ferritin [Clostridia bacterium]|nr:ferritin [Clostridia bacterium]
MVSENILGLLNEQIKKELHSAYLYKGIEAYFENLGLKGMANWFMVQAQEEMGHAMKFFNYVNEVGGLVQLGTIEAVTSKYKSPLEAMKASLEHERYITASIYKIVDAAIDERDHKTNSFLQWFIDEQVEEEANAEENVRNLELVKDSPNGLFMVNAELAKRVYVPITTPQA